VVTLAHLSFKTIQKIFSASHFLMLLIKEIALVFCILWNQHAARNGQGFSILLTLGIVANAHLPVCLPVTTLTLQVAT
jgi:hypothetical protein